MKTNVRESSLDAYFDVKQTSTLQDQQRKITQCYLKEILNYDSESGIFTWKNPISRKCKRGEVAGGINRSVGYRFISINNRRHAEHRLAWLYVYGNLPSDFIDHIDGNRLNNRINNLRNAKNYENHQNRIKNKNNKSGYVGVCFVAEKNKYKAQITLLGKCYHLGYFTDAHSASLVYLKAKKDKHKFNPIPRVNSMLDTVIVIAGKVKDPVTKKTVEALQLKVAA